MHVNLMGAAHRAQPYSKYSTVYCCNTVIPIVVVVVVVVMMVVLRLMKNLATP